jgi:hypothetical protein
MDCDGGGRGVSVRFKLEAKIASFLFQRPSLEARWFDVETIHRVGEMIFGGFDS